MSPTKIEWADESWNPATGCSKVSVGCKNCYAERISKRFGWPWKVTLHPDRLDKPLHWRKPRRVFVCSMGDLFHEDVPFWFIMKVFNRMLTEDHHQFLILTKRTERMRRFFNSIVWQSPAHIWLGVSVENQTTADERIPLLLQTPAAVRFVSVEPMLESVDLIRIPNNTDPSFGEGQPWIDALNRTAWTADESGYYDTCGIRPGLDWVICGGESGPGARPMDIGWARSLRDQCQAASVPFFLKQMRVDGKLVKEPKLDGQQHLEYPA